MSGRVGAVFTWAGTTLSLSLPDARWRDRLSDLLGLSAADRAADRYEIAVHDATSLRSFETELSFPTQHDLLVWLALTIVDVLAEKAGVFLIHAASLRVGTDIVLLSGAPYAGKSTLALHAHRRGLATLGDDVVRLDLDTMRAAAVPRPLRERRPDATASDEPLVLGTPLVGMLDGEACRLHPRAALREPTTEAALRIGAVYFLRRHEGPGLRLSTPTQFDAIGQFLAHGRTWGVQPFAALPRIGALLKSCPCHMLSVGDGEMDAALDLIAAAPTGAAP